MVYWCVDGLINSEGRFRPLILQKNTHIRIHSYFGISISKPRGNFVCFSCMLGVIILYSHVFIFQLCTEHSKEIYTS